MVSFKYLVLFNAPDLIWTKKNNFKILTCWILVDEYVDILGGKAF